MLITFDWANVMKRENEKKLLLILREFLPYSGEAMFSGNVSDKHEKTRKVIDDILEDEKFA